jgi:hypothetical protein
MSLYYLRSLLPYLHDIWNGCLKKMEAILQILLLFEDTGRQRYQNVTEKRKLTRENFDFQDNL